MADEKSAPRKRRADRHDQAPERVTNAAQAMMNNTASPFSQGYKPGAQQTGRQPYMPNGMQGNYPNGQQTQAYQQPMYRTPSSQTGTFQSMDATGAHRGFVIPPAPPQPKEEKKKKKGIWLALVLVIVLAGLGAGGYYGITSYLENKEIHEKVDPYDNLFCPGVYVDGIHLGGMTPEQAMNSVQSQIRQRNDAWNVSLNYQGQTIANINAQMLGMSVDVADVMNQAWIQGHSGTAEERYAIMGQLEQTPYEAYTAVPSGDTSVIDQVLEQVQRTVESPATDATLLTFDTTQAYPFIFQDEVYGRALDIAPLKEEIYRKVAVLESGTIELQPTTVEPAVKKSDLIKHYMLRSSVYTPIDKHSTDERNNNIRRAFEFINGYVLKPGKTFSFNGVVGERTEANGFYPAIEYAYGEHVMGIGGGVCQASTTVYQAAVCAGMTILKREPHSDSVSYTEYGKDATVYWGSRKKLDLTFRNDTDEPLYIVASVEQDPSNKKRLIAKVSMYGKDMGDVRYELEAVEVSTIEPPSEPKYIKDVNGTYVTHTWQQKSVSKAKEGHVVKSYRLEYTGNVLTDRKEMFTDTYEAQPEKIYVGVQD